MRLTFAEQQAKKSLVVELLDDDVAEGQEFFWLVLTEAEGCIIPPIDYPVWITDYEDCKLSFCGLAHYLLFERVCIFTVQLLSCMRAGSLISFSHSQFGESVDKVSLP